MTRPERKFNTVQNQLAGMCCIWNLIVNTLINRIMYIEFRSFIISLWRLLLYFVCIYLLYHPSLYTSSTHSVSENILITSRLLNFASNIHNMLRESQRILCFAGSSNCSDSSGSCLLKKPSGNWIEWIVTSKDQKPLRFQRYSSKECR